MWLGILFWPVAGLLVVCAAWVFLLRTLNSEKRATERSGHEIASKIAMIEASQTEKNLTMTDQAILLVRAHLTAFGQREQLSLFIRSLIPSGATIKINVFASNGVLVATSEPSDASLPNASPVSQQPFFSEQKNSTADFLYIGAALKNSGEDSAVAQYSRKLLNKHGQFSGVVSVESEAANLTSGDSKALSGDTGFTVTVGHNKDVPDFLLRSGQPPTATMLASLRDVRGSDKGSVEVVLRPGGEYGRYFVAWQALATYPIIVVTAVEKKGLLAFYKERESAAIQTATGASLIMLAFIVAATALTTRLELQRYRLKEAQAAYRTATELGSEGFFIAKPLRDGAGAIVDYITTDCNERGASFFYKSRDAVIGEPLSSFGALLPFDLVMEKFTEAMESGSAEFTLRIVHEARDCPWFMNATAVKADGILAITLRDVTLEKVHLSSLERQTNEDALTGLPNRAWLTKMLPALIVAALDSSKMLAVLFVDLDGFKAVNDTYGHATGDELLKVVSQRLKVAVRPKDRVVRIGGDEFIIILESLAGPEDADVVAARVVEAFQQPFAVTSGIVTVGTSIGISIYPLDASDPDSLLRHADMAMYAVKIDGKNRYQHFESALFAERSEKAKLGGELRSAIREKQFVMHYQPRVDLVTGAVCSLEALVRWNHPTEGLIGPDRFIPLAEETALILDLGELIIDIVCIQLSVWSQQGGPVLPVSINVSSRQFNEVDIYASISAALARHNVAASSVEIELTESTMLTDSTKAAQCLRALHELGVSLLVDDFGTGYSSLSMLQELEFDILKVDKSFTRRLDADHKGEVFFNAIITMAHALGMKVIAEGVETCRQMEILQRLGCDEVQGFYLFRPRAAMLVQARMWKMN